MRDGTTINLNMNTSNTANQPGYLAALSLKFVAYNSSDFWNGTNYADGSIVGVESGNATSAGGGGGGGKP